MNDLATFDPLTARLTEMSMRPEQLVPALFSLPPISRKNVITARTELRFRPGVFITSSRFVRTTLGSGWPSYVPLRVMRIPPVDRDRVENRNIRPVATALTPPRSRFLDAALLG